MINRLTVSATLVVLALYAQASTEEPTMVTRKEQRYVAIRKMVTLQGMATVVPTVVPQLHAWLDAHKLKPAGAPFIRYIVVDMDKELDIEVGLPVATPVSGDSHVTTGVLPAGRYASLTHFGNYNGLIPPNAQIQRWGMDRGLTWKMRKTKHGEEWVGRIEFYKTDPDKEPDPSKWETEILYLVADTNRRK